MPKSTYLGLEYTNDATTLFQAWRKSVNGSGEATKSNAELIDAFAGEIFDSIRFHDMVQDTTDKYKFYLTASDIDLVDHRILYAHLPATILEDPTDSNVVISIDGATTYKNLVDVNGTQVTVDKAFKRGRKIIFVYESSDNSWYPFATDKDFSLLAGVGWNAGETVRGNYLAIQVLDTLIADILVALGSSGQIIREIIDMTIPVVPTVTETKLVFDTLTTPTNDDTVLDVDVNGDVEMLDENTAGYRLSALVSVLGTQPNPSTTSTVRFNLYINGSATPSDTFDVTVGKDETVNKPKEYTYVVPIGEAPDVATVKAQLISGSVSIENFTVTAQSLFIVGGSATPSTTDVVTLKTPSTESPSGSSTTQQEVNIENVNRIKHYTGTLLVASWTGSSAPYSLALTVTGILATDKPIIDLDLSSVTYANVAAKQADWALIYRCASSADTITFYASTAPTEELAINIEVVR